MKNLLLLSVFILSGFQLFSQKIKEPDFIGESVIVKADSTTVKLEKNIVQIKTKQELLFLL